MSPAPGRVTPVTAPQLKYYVVARAGQTAIMDRESQHLVGWIVHSTGGLLYARIRTSGTRTTACHTIPETPAAFAKLTPYA